VAALDFLAAEQDGSIDAPVERHRAIVHISSKHLRTAYRQCGADAGKTAGGADLPIVTVMVGIGLVFEVDKERRRLRDAFEIVIGKVP
jgi:hypothetical protein